MSKLFQAAFFAVQQSVIEEGDSPVFVGENQTGFCEGHSHAEAADKIASEIGLKIYDGRKEKTSQFVDIFSFGVVDARHRLFVWAAA